MALPPVVTTFAEHRSPGKGVDFAVPVGTRLGAPFDGVAAVELIPGASYGLHVRIWQGQTEVIIAHLSAVTVVSGERVRRGTEIGRSGGAKTDQPFAGNSTGPHVHFEIRQAGQTVNPMPFVGNLFTPTVSRRTRPVGSLPTGTAPDPKNVAGTVERLLDLAEAVGKLRPGERDIPFVRRDAESAAKQYRDGKPWAEVQASWLGGFKDVKDIPVLGQVASVADFLGVLTQARTWVRVAEVLGGAVVGVLALRMLGRALEQPGLANLGSGIVNAVPVARAARAIKRGGK